MPKLSSVKGFVVAETTTPFPCVKPISPYSTSQLVSLPFEVQLNTADSEVIVLISKFVGFGHEGISITPISSMSISFNPFPPAIALKRIWIFSSKLLKLTNCSCHKSLAVVCCSPVITKTSFVQTPLLKISTCKLPTFVPCIKV